MKPADAIPQGDSECKPISHLLAGWLAGWLIGHSPRSLPPWVGIKRLVVTRRAACHTIPSDPTLTGSMQPQRAFEWVIVTGCRDCNTDDPYSQRYTG